MMQVQSLNDFNTPLFGERAIVALINNSPISCDKTHLHDETQSFTSYIRDWKDIIVTPDMLATRESARTFGAGDLFLPVEHSTMKKLVSILREKGLIETLRVTADEEPQRVGVAFHWLATKITSMMAFIESKLLVYEGLASIDFSSVPDIAATQDWPTALVRCLAWHPHCSRLALASRDDRIRIFSHEMGKSIATLRHAAQKSVCSMSWRPNTGRELAAACLCGVLVWTIELGAASNSLSQAKLLRQRNHAPVTGVSWNPQGNLLISCSPNDSSMIVWDVASEIGVPLKRVGGGGICLSRWSPSGDKLFAATCRTVFRVWDTGVGNAWTVERWSVPSGRVSAACFGAHTVLFTSTDDSTSLFSVSLRNNIFDVKGTITSDDFKAAVPLIDLSRVTFAGCDGDVVVGGRVLSMDWDPSGSYLAILFKESPLVAIFKTISTNSCLMEITPGCLVKGFSKEIPNCLQFHQSISDNRMKACLTIAWSSGRIQQFPIVENNQIPTITFS